MKSCSTLSFSYKICECKCDPSLNVIPAATTGLLIPHALPNIALLGTKQYWIFFYSHNVGRVIIIYNGSQSAAKITTSTELFVISLSTSLTPFLTCFNGNSCWISSHIFLVNLASATGSGFRCFYYIVFFFSSSLATSNKFTNYFFSILL